jgi:hypothetical protein
LTHGLRASFFLPNPLCGLATPSDDSAVEERFLLLRLRSPEINDSMQAKRDPCFDLSPRGEEPLVKLTVLFAMLDGR